MVLFPEGTRYTPALPQVIAKSQSFSESNGNIILANLLINDLVSMVNIKF
jgi:hypothetical protein